MRFTDYRFCGGMHTVLYLDKKPSVLAVSMPVPYYMVLSLIFTLLKPVLSASVLCCSAGSACSFAQLSKGQRIIVTYLL